MQFQCVRGKRERRRKKITEAIRKLLVLHSLWSLLNKLLSGVSGCCCGPGATGVYVQTHTYTHTHT